MLLSQCDSFLSPQLLHLGKEHISIAVCLDESWGRDWDVKCSRKAKYLYFCLVIANFEFIIECRLLFSSIMYLFSWMSGPRIYFFMLSCGLSWGSKTSIFHGFWICGSILQPVKLNPSRKEWERERKLFVLFERIIFKGFLVAVYWRKKCLSMLR